MMTSALHPNPTTSPAFYRGVAIKRAFAWIMDVVFIAVLCAIIVPFTAFTGLFFFPLLMLAVGFLYRWFTLSSGSATWGMRIMAIEIRDHDGMRLESSTALAHTVGYTASVMVFPAQLVSVIMMIATERGQGLTDMVLGTAAINKPARLR